MKRIPGIHHLETAIANAHDIQQSVMKGERTMNDLQFRTITVVQQLAAGLTAGLQAIYDEVQKK